MTDDRSLERAARSFIEPGPTRAPEAALERALDLIQTTRQERGLRIPRRFRTMNTPARVAAAAVICVLAIGGAAFMLRPTGPDAATRPAASTTLLATPSDELAQLQAYRAARSAICTPLARISEPGPSAAPSEVVTFLQATIARQNREVTGLEAIEVPTALRSEHLADIQTAKDVNALLNHMIELIQTNKMADVAAVDAATGSLNTLREAFSTKYALPACP
jgi:hypothetical protein